ncbi:transporter substrate-binding domain-containing protein [Paenibacillus beijingensis]|uniref:Amino acid ABC transporter substrate-binding protein n=1 Tax=Paenibacillus beijingensis TaxID=1126833 RepID=A0A0D5NP92_9BACL|nr:transporter substrate-binding domain-containing protein [Paenibacillus beijingensis]AJY76723.1 hypothetical protein VN24_21815 [Paenibacillus beijingensis]
MVKRSKWWITGLVGLMFILALAGCGAKESNSGSTASEATNSTSGAGSEGESSGSQTLDAIKKRDKLVVGVKYDTRLFGLKDPASGNVEGFDIDIAKALAKKVLGDETKLELKEVTSKTRIPMLKNGDIDAIIATMTITEERKEQVEFSDVYFKAGQSLLVKKGSPITGLPDVKKGVKVLAVKGSTSVDNIKEKAPEATVLQFETYLDAFNALKAGQGEVLTTDNAILLGLSSQDSNYVLVGDTFTDEPYGIAVVKGDTGFAKTINDLLAEMKADGSYAEIYKKWFNEEPKI